MIDQEEELYDIAAVAPCTVCGTKTFTVDRKLQAHICGWECREDYIRTNNRGE